MTANRSAPQAVVVPILVYEDVGEALEFLSRAFGFKERLRAEWGGSISHAQMDIGSGSIMMGKQGGPFTGLFDFCRRVDRRLVNRRAAESLVRAGAFDSLCARRSALVATVGMAMDDAERASLAANQHSLFAAVEETQEELPLVERQATG